MRLPQLCHKPDGLFVFGVLVFLHSCFKIVSTQPGVNLSPSLIFKFNLGIFTARQRSLRRLCFYTCLSVILFTGRGVPGQVPSPTGGRYTPPGRYPLAGTPQAGTPSPHRYTPQEVHLPPQCMLGYGQEAGSTHPTGMHSCFNKTLPEHDSLKVHSF